VTLEGETIVVNLDGGLIEAGEEKFAVFEEWLMSLWGLGAASLSRRVPEGSAKDEMDVNAHGKESGCADGYAGGYEREGADAFDRR
jgi:hypothetical protein